MERRLDRLILGAGEGLGARSLDHLNTKKSRQSSSTPPMSLYYEAAAVLANPDRAGGSLKSRIYKQKDLKSSPAQIVALVTEASKWSAVLKEVIEQSGLLAEEKKVCFPLLRAINSIGSY